MGSECRLTIIVKFLMQYIRVYIYIYIYIYIYTYMVERKLSNEDHFVQGAREVLSGNS